MRTLCGLRTKRRGARSAVFARPQRARACAILLQYMDVTVWRDGKNTASILKRAKISGAFNGRNQKQAHARCSVGPTVLPISIFLRSIFWICSNGRLSSTPASPSVSETRGSGFETTDFLYENGIVDYAAELAGDDALTTVYIESELLKAATVRTNRNTRSSSPPAFAFQIGQSYRVS